MSSGPFLPEEKKVVLSLISCTAIGAAEVWTATLCYTPPYVQWCPEESCTGWIIEKYPALPFSWVCMLSNHLWDCRKMKAFHSCLCHLGSDFCILQWICSNFIRSITACLYLLKNFLPLNKFYTYPKTKSKVPPTSSRCQDLISQADRYALIAIVSNSNQLAFWSKYPLADSVLCSQLCSPPGSPWKCCM
jgi:hypothetical protein